MENRGLPIRFIIGASVTLVVFGLAIAAIFAKEQRIFGDVKNQPPGFRPIEAGLNRVRIQGTPASHGPDFDILSVGEPGAFEDGEAPDLVVGTRYAVSGRPYRSRIHLEKTPQPGGLVLLLRPAGARFEKEADVLFWDIPAESAGTYPRFVFQYTSECGGRARYELTLPVSRESHMLGTDNLGRDTLTRLFLSMRQIAFPGLIAAAVSTILGTMIGALAGYYEGHARSLLGFLMNLLGSFPRVVLAIVITLVFNPNLYIVMAVIGIANLPRVARIVETRVGQLKDSQFVEAAKELGLRDRSIIGRHILWHNCRPIVITQASFIMGEAAALEAALTYIGSGSHWRAPSLGDMIVIAKADALINGNYSQFLIPSVVLAIAFLGFMLLGDGLCEIFSRRYRMSVGAR